MDERKNDIPISLSHPMAKLNQTRRAMKKANNLRYDFGLGDPSEPTPEFLLRTLKSAIGFHNHYPRTGGSLNLRVDAAGYIERRYGVKLNPDKEIIATNGSKEAIFNLPIALKSTRPEKYFVLFGKPSYPGYEAGCFYSGLKSIILQLQESDGYALPYWDIPSSIAQQTLIIWINYPHNPTGAIVGSNYLKKLHEFCLSHNIILISDDCYADIWHGDKAPSSVLQSGKKNIISLHSCSKRSGMTGFRTGFMCGDDKLISICNIHRKYFGIETPGFIQEMSTAAWNEDYHAEQRRMIFNEKAEILISGLIQKGLTFFGSQGGIFLWAQLPEYINDIEYIELCRKYGILVAPGSIFGADNSHVRIALSPSVEDCRNAVEAWPPLDQESNFK
jgi:succinyldiaminopimelate transaminase